MSFQLSLEGWSEFVDRLLNFGTLSPLSKLGEWWVKYLSGDFKFNPRSNLLYCSRGRYANWKVQHIFRQFLGGLGVSATKSPHFSEMGV